MDQPTHPRSLVLGLYLFVSRRAAGWAERKLRDRAAQGREDPARALERRGIASLPRPPGPLIWFHAASVGEAVSLLELLRRLRLDCPDVTPLVTSGTVTSAEMMETRLPEGCLHQYSTVDVLPWVERFLDHWQPDLAVWTESELWPATLSATAARDIPMLLINARLSQQSFRRWSRFRGAARSLLRRFWKILAQDGLAAEHLSALGADPNRLMVGGTLKEGSAPLPDDEAARGVMVKALAGRSVWLAASTHHGEEDVVLAAHKIAARTWPGLLLILVPRHPDRGNDLAAMIEKEGLVSAQRSKGDALTDDTDVYLADTLGELGIWYRVSPVSFVGGSLIEIGGHNPYEPALLGSAILHGPYVRNFAGAYKKFTQAGAACLVDSTESLSERLVDILAPDRAAQMAAAGWDVCSESAEVTDLMLGEVKALLDAKP